MAATELAEARLSKLEAETAQDYAEAIVAYNERRIGRLQTFLKSEPAEGTPDVW